MFSLLRALKNFEIIEGICLYYIPASFRLTQNAFLLMFVLLNEILKVSLSNPYPLQYLSHPHLNHESSSVISHELYFLSIIHYSLLPLTFYLSYCFNTISASQIHSSLYLPALVSKLYLCLIQSHHNFRD